jgi:hypothetical protein
MLSPRFPLRTYMLYNDASRPTFKKISHELPTLNRKPFSLYSILHFTYPNQIIINTQGTETIRRFYSKRNLRNFRAFISPLHYLLIYRRIDILIFNTDKGKRDGNCFSTE